MKNILKCFLGVFVLTAMLLSCKKDERPISVEASTAPVLTATPLVTLGATTTLMQADSIKPFMKLSWTNPNYRFTTGASSQDVNYVLQIDTTGSNFTAPNKKEVSISKSLDSTFNVRAFNTLLSNVLENMPHNVEMRIKASIGSAGSLPLYSNVIKMVVTPYLDVAVPIPTSGKLYITGSATPGNWMGGGDPELAAQRFSRVSNTLYEVTVALSAGNSFVFVPVYGDWSNKYGFTGAKNGNNVDGDTFKKEGEDLKAPAQSGTYKITVNFKTGTYTAVKQ